MNQRGPSPNCRRDVYGFSHLVDIRAFLEGVRTVGVYAVRALDGVSDREGNQRLLPRGERPVLEYR